MQSLYKKSSFVVLAAVAAALGLLFAPASARGADPTTTGGLSKGNPQSTFNINERDMPAVDNSLFRPPSAGYDASNGNVSVSNGEVRGNVYGGIDPATAGGVSNKNKVAMSDVTVGGNVTGGWSRSGTASENAVTITNNGYSVGGLVYGGWVRGGTSAGGGASKNIVTINSGIFNDNMYGGFSQGSNGDIAENQVIIKGGTIVKNVRPENDPHIIAGGYSSVGSNRVVEKNEVKIEGGTITNFWIYGGRGQTNATTITNNTVSISGGTIQSGGTHAGDRGSYIYGGEGITGSAAVLDNHVIISGGDVTATMYGGYARAGGAVTQNDVTISGGRVRGDIYGGYSVSGVATNNTVTIEGATTELIGVRLYGGATVSGGDAFTGNTLDKKSEADVSEAHNFQYVTFENYATNGNAKIGFLDTTASGSSQSGVTITTGSHDITFTGRIWGSGDVTTKAGSNKFIITDNNNEIWHTNGVTIESGTLQIGDGGYTGDFKTPQFQVSAGATLAYNREGTITYDRQIRGAGTLEQMGGDSKTGTLVLTGDSSDVKFVNVTGGTLQLGDGGAGGSIAAEKFTLDENTTLAYKQNDAVSYTGDITGAGKVVQRGSGSLLLNDAANPSNTTLPRNSFTGGTEIESGTLYIVDLTSYNQANKNSADPAYGTKAGYITFTGADQPGRKKQAALLSGVMASQSVLHNSFRTDTNAGKENYVDLTALYLPIIRGNSLHDGKGGSNKGGAFYVADNTAMNVDASRLVLGGDNHDEDLFNKAGGQNNDLYIGQGAKFNLYVDDYATFNSGIDGEATSTGVLNLRPLMSSSARSYASVYLINNTSDAAQIFHTGTTNVEGNEDKSLVLYLTRGRITGDNDFRVTFENDTSFNLNQYAVLSADGTIKAGEEITVKGAGLYPHAMSRHDMDYDEKSSPGTLLLEAPDITLNNFSMIYDIKGPQAKLANETPGRGLGYVSNNSLLDFVTEGNKVTLENGSVYFRTTTGSPFKTDDYLVMRSNNGFQDAGGTPNPINNGNVNDHLTAYIDGFTLNPDSNSVRGDGMKFVMGGDPDDSGGNSNSSDNNIWLSASLNSLSMDWTGADGSEFKSGNLFNSEQGDDSTREHSFMPGDKLYISKSGANLELLPPGEAGSPDALTSIAVTVSGLVVGKNTAGDIAAGGAYTFSGEGGLTADKTSAHGTYVKDQPDDIANDGDILNPTGKLEKFGDSTLTFLNEGTNVFMDGIELSGGTTQFTRAEQLVDGSYTKAQSEPDGPFTYTPNPTGGGTKFLQNSTLEALADVELYNHITIDSTKTATLSAQEGRVFTYGGILAGAANTFLNKVGAGTLELFSDMDTDGESDFAGLMTVREGLLNVRGSFALANVEVHGDNGTETLSGTGVLKAGRVFANGTLAPGTIENDLKFKDTLAFDAGSHFRVSLENNGVPRSEYVTVGRETTIDSQAVLDVAFDYWGSKAKLTDVYRIIEAANGQTNQADEFTLGGLSSLPRGLAWEQGWNLAQRTGDEYQLKLVRDYGHGVDDIPGLSHNENEVGKIIDDMVDEPDGPMGEVVERVTDPDLTDDEARRRLNQLTGDLTANALYMAFKEPWRHPFNRLEHGSAAPPAGDGDPRLWAEYTSRYEETDSDGNAHDFTIERYGVALGLDHHISPRLTLGANLQFSRPTLKQDTGEVTADDLEIGLYGLAAVSDNLDMKMYLGYSWQRYDFERQVSLPASPAKYAALHENLDGETNGRAIAASIELIRPIDLRPDFRLSPALALDYEKVWVDAYTESGGLTALAYDDTEMEHVTLRAGLAGEYTWRDRAILKARAQYSAQIGGRDYPALGVHFAGDALARRADIRGASSGRHYLNLGLGGNFKIGDGENSLLYLNYDAKLNNRTSIHAAEAGVMLVW